MAKSIDLERFWRSRRPDERQEIAAQLGSNVRGVAQVCLGTRKASRPFVIALKHVLGVDELIMPELQGACAEAERRRAAAKRLKRTRRANARKESK